ncbi:MAG: chromate transporter [Tissierellia bacterium]|nr:chromate transporter [Tissierellia bacterium]
MIYIKLYLAFLKIGFLAFGGGYASLPIIQDSIVNNHSWITTSEMTDIVSISQMTPGPVAVNAATFVGVKMAGVLGGIIATLGIITPAFIILLTLMYFISLGSKLITFNSALRALSSAVAILILFQAIEMFQTSIFIFNSGIKIKIHALVTCILGFILYYKQVSISKIILISALTGILYYFLT